MLSISYADHLDPDLVPAGTVFKLGSTSIFVLADPVPLYTVRKFSFITLFLELTTPWTFANVLGKYVQYTIVKTSAA